jgi:hypothetical protein
VSVELGNTDLIPDDVILDGAEEEDAIDSFLEVFGTRPSVLGFLLVVVVRFPSVELDPTFDRVRLATTGDVDTNNPSLEALDTRLWVVELLLLATVGCTSVGMNAGDSVLEFAVAVNVCTAFEESKVVVAEFCDEADSLDFEVTEVALVILGY